MSSESIGAVARRGLRLLALRTAAAHVLSVVRMALLARLLAPSEFGEFAFALALQAGLLVFTEIGVRTLAIQRPALDERALATVWGLELLRACLLGGSLVLVAPWLAERAGFPGLDLLVCVLAATSVVSALENPTSMLSERAVQLGPITLLETVQQLAELGFAVVLALTYPTSTALALSLFSARAICVLLSHRIFPRPPRPRLDRAELAALWNKGKYVLLVGVGTFVTAQADDLIVGGLLGPVMLGAYYAAYRIAMLPMQLMGVGRRVLLPALARMQGDSVRLGRAFSRAARLQLSVLVPCSLGLLAFADGVVQVALGSAWESSVPTLRALSLVCFARGLCHVAMSLLAATGRFAFDARAKWLEVMVFVPSVWLATVHFGAQGAAIGAGLSYSLGALLRVAAVNSAFPGAVAWSRDILREVLWCAPGLAVSGVAVRLLEWPSTWGAVVFCAVWGGLAVTCRRELVAEAVEIAGVSRRAPSVVERDHPAGAPGEGAGTP